MSEKDRIEAVMEQVQMNVGEFATAIGVSNSTLSHVLNERNKASLDVMTKILKAFPHIHSDWLILGNGRMSREEINSQIPSLFDNSNTNTYKPAGYSDNSTKRNEIKIEENGKKEDSQKVSIDISPISTTKNRKIERIIIYYDDLTFEEFKK